MVGQKRERTVIVVTSVLVQPRAFSCTQVLVDGKMPVCDVL